MQYSKTHHQSSCLCASGGPSRLKSRGPSEAPLWVHQKYDLTQTLVRKYYDCHSQQVILAIGPHSSLVPNQFGGMDEEWFLIWYDEQGKLLIKTPNLIPNHFQLIGRCISQKLRTNHRKSCKDLPHVSPHPPWLLTQFPLIDYSILKYKHRHYGTIYAITPKRIVGSGTLWYDYEGQFLYRSPLHECEKLPFHQRCADNQWNKSITFKARI